MTQHERHAVALGGARRRLLVVLNPVAGRGRQRWLGAVLRHLEAEAAAVTVRETGAPGDARRFAAEVAAGEADAVIVAGGDGTLNEAANGLAANPAAPALGVIPLGTANVFATELGLPRDPAGLAQCLAGRPAVPILPGRVDGRVFLMMASVGFDARVVRDIDLDLKRRIGKGAYVWQSLIELARGRRRHFRVRCQERDYEVEGVVAARGRHYGGAYVIAAGADLARPGFEVLLLAKGGRGATVRQSLALGLGRFERLPELTVLRADALEIGGAEGEPVQADGDIVARLPVRIELAPAPLRVIGV